MAQAIRTWTLSQIAEIVQGQMEGEDVAIVRPVPAGYDDPRGITFAGNEQYLKKALDSQVAAIIVPNECPSVPKPVIKVDNPRAAFGIVLALSRRPLPLNQGVHDQAVVGPGAQIDETAQIGPFAVVENGARIEAGAQIFPHCYVGEGCVVGENAILYPNVVLYQDVHIGAKAIIHSGVVLGADGFGYAWTGHDQMKIPQVGGVIIGENVEIGANTCIDRATCGETTVGNGTKVDNLVQVAHNVSIGENTVLASLVGIAGSTEIGDRVVMGGQAGTADHVKVGDDVVLGGRTGVVSDVTEPGEYFGLPPVPIKRSMRSIALQQKLPELFQRIKALEKQVKDLQND